MAPAHWFFCRRIEIPADLEKGEEEGFALLELEGLSPFPLEHLHFGYILDESGRFAFVFAAYKRRFEKVDSSDWRRIDAVLPDFLIALHREAKSDDGLVLVTETSLAAFSFDSQSSLPAAFYSEARHPVGEDEDADSSLRRQVERFSSLAKERLGIRRPRILHTNPQPKWERNTAWFSAKSESDSATARLAFSREQIWKADLRDPELLDLAKRDERQNRILWKTIGVLAACVGLMLLGELYWGASAGYLSYRESKISKLEPLVREIDSLQSTSFALREFQESDLKPFEMITALMPFQQKPSVIYRKFETNGTDSLIIDAKTPNRTQANEFKKRLDQFDKVDSVELSRYGNKGSEVTFTATIRFKAGAFKDVSGVVQND